MKKQTRHKSPAEIENEASAKRAAALETCHTQCSKLGKAVRFSFLRIFIRGLEISESKALQEFDLAVKAGKIRQVGTNAGGDVDFFQA